MLIVFFLLIILEVRFKGSYLYVCAANRRAHKGSSAQLATIGLDTSYIENAVQTLVKQVECKLHYSSISKIAWFYITWQIRQLKLIREEQNAFLCYHKELVQSFLHALGLSRIKLHGRRNSSSIKLQKVHSALLAALCKPILQPCS
jgi:hypothetical protein